MRRSLALGSLGAAGAAWLLLSSCSVLYDLSPDQCSRNDDCESFGSEFQCDDGICVSTAAGGGGRGGRSGGGGTSTGGSDEMGGTTSTGGISGSDPGGTGGTGPVAECEFHADCLGADGDLEPKACIQGSCVLLKSDDCPLVLPLADDLWYQNLSTPGANAIILGAFSQFTQTLTNQTRNYDLAVTELTNKVTGLQGADGETRPVIVLVCKDTYPTTEDLIGAAGHMIDDLHVPGIITGLLADDLQAVFDQKARDARTFLLSSYESDQTLVNLQDGGRVWHMLSGGSQLAVSYKPALERAITYMQSAAGGSVTGAIKVALVTAPDVRLFADIRDEVVASIEFNGKSALDNDDDGNFKAIQISSIYANPNEDETPAINALLAFRPHVIITATSTEFLTKIVPAVEDSWGTGGQPRPFYLLSPYHYNNAQMGPLVNARTSLRPRLVGVNWPAAEDDTVYRDYLFRFNQAYPEAASGSAGFENFYDAAYYLLYATAAAGRPPELTGDALADGMLRLLGGTNAFRVGPQEMVDALSILQNTSANITLDGAMGPPNFDGSGARADAGSIWCLDTSSRFVPDVLRYNSSNESLAGDMMPCANQAF